MDGNADDIVWICRLHFWPSEKPTANTNANNLDLSVQSAITPDLVVDHDTAIVGEAILTNDKVGIRVCV